MIACKRASIGLLFLSSLSGVLPTGHKVDIVVDLATKHPVSDKLWGVFFEEINHAGEGGLYAELIQDRSFDALAFTTGFHASDAESLELTPEILSAAAEPKPKDMQLWADEDAQLNPAARAKREIIRSRANAISQPVSWHPLEATTVALTRANPLSANNPVSMGVTAHKAGGGLANSGFWGVPLYKGRSYYFSVYLKGDSRAKVRLALTSADGKETHDDIVLKDLSQRWQKFSGNLTSDATDTHAVLALTLLEPGSIVVDSLSLFPLDNIRPGWQNPYPFREDLLQVLKDLWPRFLRFPGGCYVEGGDWLKNRFPWRTSLGPYENRTGHLNDIWGYWSTDGLGLYEYMLLAEELKAEPIYVVNNGVAHQESVQPADLQPFLDEAMDALEFLTGSPDSTWGAERARMGREKPWTIRHLAIGNEDCGKPFYTENYNAFYSAIKTRHPEITLISNCPMGDAAPTDLYDWHSYDAAWTMFQRRHEFDGLDRATQPPVFVSEYAVTQDGGWCNLRGAVAEASFMTSLERNSDIVQLASYAPLFVHTHNRIWPTNMIVIDNHRSYKTPSYLVQQLFSHFQGVLSASTTVTTEFGTIHNELVSASATCQDHGCQKVVVKAVNYDSYRQPVTVRISGEPDLDFNNLATVYHVSGDHPEAENSFEKPDNVVMKKEALKLSGISRDGAFTFKVDLPAWSVSVFDLTRRGRSVPQIALV